MTDCARRIGNFSKISRTDRFDKKGFNPELMQSTLKDKSPKLIRMLENIIKIDQEDYRKHKKVFKHFIFSDVDKGYGAKIIASAMISAGYELVLKNKGTKIVIDEKVLNSKGDNKFAVLSSTALWNTTVTRKDIKEILSVFNKRPDNIYGENIRFIILDSGFKEGIDLFDVKYAHIFEEQRTQADLTQAVGRVLRFCGQNGLPFVPGKGWKVKVFNYQLYIPGKSSIFDWFKGKKDRTVVSILNKENSKLAYTNNFINSVDSLLKKGAVDATLNKNINRT